MRTIRNNLATHDVIRLCTAMESKSNPSQPPRCKPLLVGETVQVLSSDASFILLGTMLIAAVMPYQAITCTANYIQALL